MDNQFSVFVYTNHNIACNTMWKKHILEVDCTDIQMKKKKKINEIYYIIEFKHTNRYERGSEKTTQ